MGGAMKDIKLIIDLLTKTYPQASCELLYRNPFELLIATILSAQATDKKVNQITPKLFKKYKSPEDFIKLSQQDLENEIKQIGLYRTKSKNILETCRILVSAYNGNVPADREALESLPGVGRKTANVVLSNAFNIPAIAVDTHVFRVANRIGIANSNNVMETEQQLMEAIPKSDWIKTHHLLIWHGRRICDAKRPKCDICPLILHCDYPKNKI